MRIGIITMRHPPTRQHSIVPDVMALLAGWGVSVDLIFPEERVSALERLRPEHDLYVLKSGSDLALSLAGALDAVGAAILNPYPIATRVRDKVIATRILQAAGVPCPDTFLTAHAEMLAPLLDEGPLVVKPHRGSQGRGVHVIWDADELEGVRVDEGPIFAQRYHEPDGLDRKLYVVNGKIFGVQRVFPARTYDEKLGRPFTVTPELSDIALRCGRAFGLGLYGLDIILSGGAPLVVDFSIFPGFKGVPDAALRLADYIYAAAQRVLAGDNLLVAA